MRLEVAAERTAHEPEDDVVDGAAHVALDALHIDQGHAAEAHATLRADESGEAFHGTTMMAHSG